MEFIRFEGTKRFPSGRTRRTALYRCDCGNETIAVCHAVNTGNTRSCGCLAIKAKQNNNRKHGLSTHHLYHMYHAMRKRTTNPNASDYAFYGGKGIRVCDEWRNSFQNFYDWAMNNNYKDGLTIDRINNNGNYEPKNCRFVDRTVQARNTRLIRVNNTTGFRGVKFDKRWRSYVAMITVNYKRKYLGSFREPYQAAFAYDAYVVANKLEHTANFKIQNVVGN